MSPWPIIQEAYNLGVALSSAQVKGGLGGKTALVWSNAAGQERVLTYAELDRQSSALAGSLRRLGIRKGDRVFLRLPIIPEFYIAAIAIAKLGAVFIPSSTQFKQSEVEYRLRDSGAVATITSTQLAEPVERAAPACRDLRHIVIVPYPEPPTHWGEVFDFNELVRQESATFIPETTRHDDLAFIAYTSGTTGDPKGVVHFQRYPLAYSKLIDTWHDYRADDIVACPSDLGWMLPVACTFLFALSRGLTVVLYDPMGGKFEPSRWFELFERCRITNFTAPPTVYRMLLMEAADATRRDLASWRHGVAAGEPLPTDTLEGIRRQFGVTLFDGLGMSECMVYCHNRVGLPVRAGSCGQPSPGIDIGLLNEDLEPVTPGAEGVLCVRRAGHPGMMKEYWNKPAQTTELFRGEWYYSGDVLTCDADGYYWFKGRCDDVIKASGYRISPFEIESCLLEHPAVQEAAAVESPDAIRGNVIKAFIVLRTGSVPGDDLATDIRAFVQSRIASYKTPRKIQFVVSLPKTTSGKIKRRELRAREKE